jgi:sialate O-acetylesterase
MLQLAATGNNNQSDSGFPKIRWAQTANYGSVPNDRLQNVFMAVAMDLGDPDSPLGSIHPRDKQDVGARLVLSARAVAYKDDTSYYQGPLADTAVLRYSS